MISQLVPIVTHVMNKYKTKLSKEDLKRFGKEVSINTQEMKPSY